jgi:spermidine synthase
MPTLGITGTIWTASALNFTIFIFASRLSLRLSGAVADEDLLPGTSLAHYTTADRYRWFLYALAFFTGAGALAYEVIWTHIQAFTIGSTVYAFGIMLFTVLCGLAIGAQVVARRMHDSESWVPALALSLVGLGAAVLLTTPVWGLLNFVFESDIRITLLSGVIGLFVLRILWKKAIAWRTREAITEKRPGHRWALALLIVLGLIPLGLLLRGSSTRYFLATEMVRFLCAFYLIIVPACLLGMSFPLLLSLSASSTKRLGADVGGIYSANTLGAIVGSIITGFFILPKFGSQTTLRALGSLNVFLGFLVASLWSSTHARRLALAGAGAVALLFGWIVLPGWNGSRLMRGSYVYFNRAQVPDRVLYMREDIQGGLTSVIQDGPIHTLLSNGKFQGNNGGEAAAQSRFALIPSLFTRQFDRALVIGLGTGYTTKALLLFPFQRIDVAELAAHIVEAARLWFADVNDGVLDRDPRVKVTITDGRNFLLLSRERYDLITIEITSIWISGEADLYNREFYELCRDHLSSHGVLQQWVQIHHMRTQDLLVIFNTAAQVFPHLAFFLGPHQALLVASTDPLDFDYAQVQTLDEIPGIKAELARLHVPSLMSFLGEIILYDNSVRRALAFLPRGGAQERFVSTDLYPYLEYATPKGNVVPYNTVEPNRNFLLKLRPLPLPPELRITNLPSENEKNLVLGYVAERQGDIPRAINHFQQAHGAVQERAQREITRLSNR